jgi:hypothetical protein
MSHKPWVMLPLHEDAVTTTFLNSSIHCIVGDSRSTWFWLDRWLDGRSIADRAPELLAAMHAIRQNTRSVAIALDQNAWLCYIAGALTLPALLQYVEIREWLETFQLQPSLHDAMV